MAAAAAMAALGAARSGRGRRWLLWLAVACVAGLAFVVAVPVGIAYAVFAGFQASNQGLAGCGGAAGPVPAVAGFDPSQVAVARQVVRAGVDKGVPAQGVRIALAVGIDESGLRALDYGDAAGPDSRGVFQQRESWGPLAVRMDPYLSAGLFYDRLLQVPGWQGMDPGDAGATVQIGPPGSVYDRFWGQAGTLLDALGGASCQVPQNAQEAAAQLVAAIKAGKLRFLEQRYAQQVVNMADGTAAPACLLDVRILQAMVIAVNAFGSVGVSDLNRRCTGETPGAGTASAHWQGKAVDFYAIDGVALDGANAQDIQLIRALDPIMPPGSGLGQSNCRAPLAGLVHFTVQFADTCNHQHVQVP